jgi:hypothetical protein
MSATDRDQLFERLWNGAATMDEWDGGRSGRGC